MIDQVNLREYIWGRPADEELVYSTLIDIVRIVIKRHFDFYMEANREEFESIGVWKAFSLLKAPYIKPD